MFSSDPTLLQAGPVPAQIQPGSVLVRLVSAVMVLVTVVSGQESMSNQYEQQRYDGWYNNLAHPDWGAIESHLTRKTPPSYSDGVYMMNGNNRPSARNLSQAFMKGEDGLASLKNRTALQTFFGQVGPN